jgi:hypothetical protein
VVRPFLALTWLLNLPAADLVIFCLIGFTVSPLFFYFARFFSSPAICLLSTGTGGPELLNKRVLYFFVCKSSLKKQLFFFFAWPQMALESVGIFSIKQAQLQERSP